MLRATACGSLILAVLAWPCLARSADRALGKSEPTADTSANGRGLASKTNAKPDSERTAVSAQPAASAEQTQTWINDLDSDKYAVREAAAERLLKLGRAAIEPVAAAVESKSPETSFRAMRILEEFYRSSDTVTHSFAQKAIGAIAGNPASSGAKRAKEILSPPNITPPPETVWGGGRRRRPGGGGGMGHFAILPSEKSLQIRKVDGHITLDADNGVRRVHIEEEPQGAISICVTDLDAGREQTRSFAAKNLDDLTKNQPAEARQLYQQFMTSASETPQMDRFQVRGGVVIFGPAP